MTAPIVVEGMTREELDAHVLELTREGRYDTAAEVIAEWDFWDRVGRWEEPLAPEPEKDTQALLDGYERNAVAPASVAEPLPALPGTVRGNMLAEFGDLGNYDEEPDLTD